MLIYDLKKVSRVINTKGYEREIISLIKNDLGLVTQVKYRVKKHSQAHRLETVRTISKKSMVDWLHGIQIEKDSFVKGDIVQFGEYKLHVISNKGIFGKVKDFNEGYVIEKFYWRGCSSERCYKIGFQEIS